MRQTPLSNKMEKEVSYSYKSNTAVHITGNSRNNNNMFSRCRKLLTRGKAAGT